MNKGFRLSYDIPQELARKLILEISRRNLRRALGKYAPPISFASGVTGGVGAITVALLLNESAAFSVMMFTLGYAACLFSWKRSYSKQADYASMQMSLTNDQRISADIDPSGMHFESTLGKCFVTWAAITEIWHMDGATILRSGAQSIALPDNALPDGVSVDGFVEQLSNWKSVS